MQALCQRLLEGGGSALIIDYGHVASGYGDTLQAIRAHQFDPPLAHPGEADLTSHVDFEALAKTAHLSGLHVNGVMHQGDFLAGLGIYERAEALSRGKEPLAAEDIAPRSTVSRAPGRQDGGTLQGSRRFFQPCGTRTLHRPPSPFRQFRGGLTDPSAVCNIRLVRGRAQTRARPEGRDNGRQDHGHPRRPEPDCQRCAGESLRRRGPPRLFHTTGRRLRRYLSGSQCRPRLARHAAAGDREQSPRRSLVRRVDREAGNRPSDPLPRRLHRDGTL